MGATGRVTGSCYLIESEGTRIIIDCGLFQGSAADRGKNMEPFAFDAKTIDAVIATHSHIDHIGRIPKLIRSGFNGPIYSTDPVKDLGMIFLNDTFKLMRDESRRDPERMIWDEDDLNKALYLWQGTDYHKPFKVGNMLLEFLDAGHILGSSMLKVFAEGKTVIFSGDLGNPPAPIVEDPEKIDQADYIIIESTYGNRVHEKSEKRMGELEKVLDEVEEKKGVLLIPAFALEKTQELLYELNELANQGRIGKINFFIDSPLATKATEIYAKYPRYFDNAARETIKTDHDIFNFPGLIVTRTAQQSKTIERERKPKVIIAGSGMSTGGRILGHEQLYLPDPNNIILFIGYQVKGTLGRRIKDGEPVVRIMGKEVEVRAQIREISAYSSHADQPKLINWIKNILEKKNMPKTVFVTHGEPEASSEFAKKLKEELGVNAYIPKENEEITL